MKKPQRRGPAPSAPVGVLAARGAEALQQERFKEAIELFKLLVRQEPRPEWKESLAEAYHGRARALAAKGMFKEAAMVLENTLVPDGTLRDPPLYLQCLIRDGQQAKAAAHALIYVGRETALLGAERAAWEELTAALLVACPQRPEPAGAAASERRSWLERAAACRDALAAWSNGAPAAELEPLLNRISLRSPFRPVRLLLMSLSAGPEEAERSRRRLDAISPASPFFPLRQAVEAALPGEPALDADGWSRLSPAQQGFVAQLRGLQPGPLQFLTRSSEAARSGADAQFTFLLRQSGLPREDLRSACLNLLPHCPGRVPQFEKSFGALSNLERCRVQALGAEARSEWGRAERGWWAVIDAIGDGAPQAGLSRGVVYRHLAQLAAKHHGIEGDGEDLHGDPVVSYLERSLEADPAHVPTVLELIGQYRADDRAKDWHRLAEEAVQRFPEDSQVLLAATESAVARKAYKKAAGFARRLLKIDPINPAVRRQMIELHVAHARKQVRSKRADLAAKELAGAAEWERADAPNPLLRIARGLVGMQTGEAAAEAWLREGVALAGGGAAGWFRAVLEGTLMKLAGSTADLLRRELASAREAPPTRAAVMALVAALAQPEVAENKRAVAGLLSGMHPWLRQGADLVWPPAEFEALSDVLVRFEAFGVLGELAQAARRREPANPVWRFQEILARCRANPDWLHMSEANELATMIEAAGQREDFQAAKRIERLLNGQAAAGSGRRRRVAMPEPEALDDDMAEALIEALEEGIAGGPPEAVLALVRELGREGAIASMAAKFRASPFGAVIREEMLRELCEAIVEAALAGGRPGGGRARRRSPF